MTATLRYPLIYGLLAGAVLCAFIAVIGTLSHQVEWVATLTFGYSVMLVAMSFVFVGVKRYRDVEGGGVIGFGRALGIGLLIALIAALIYVVAWEVFLAATDYRFMDDYAAAELGKARAEGKTAAEIAALAAQLDGFKQQYANPLFRMPLTFAEVAPVGLLVALVSAALLRNPRLLPARG